MLYDLIPAACHVDTVKYDHDQRNGHNNTLNQVSSRYRHKAAHNGVTYNNDSAHNHCNVIIHSEQAGEQGSDRLKAGRGVRE